MKERLGPIFVWSVWVLLTACAFGYVALWGANVPCWDEWNILVPVLTGERQFSVGWLMESYNGHRLPFPLLLIHGLLSVSKGDFTWLMYASAVSLSLVSLGMILVLRKVKGRLELTDAFIPIVTLGPTHSGTLLWGGQFWFVLAIAIAGVLLVSLSVMAEPRKWALWWISLSLVLLPMCGLIGVVLAPVPAFWAGSLAIRSWRFHHSKTWSLIVGIFALLSLALVGLQFACLQNSPVPSMPACFGLKVKTALEVVSMALGPSATRLWPWSGFVVVLIAAIALVLLAWRARGEVRGIGLTLFLITMGLLAASIGHGRAGLGQCAGFEDRYVLLALPILWAAYFVFRIYGQSRFTKALNVSLLIVGCLLIGPNWWDAMLRSLDRVQEQAGFLLDLKNGMSPKTLSQRYACVLFQDVGSVARRLSDMKRIKWSPCGLSGAAFTHRAGDVQTFNSALGNLKHVRSCLPKWQTPLVQPLPKRTAGHIELYAIDLFAIVPIGRENAVLKWKLVERTGDGGARELTGGTTVPTQIERIAGVLRVHSFVKLLATGKPFRQWRFVRIDLGESVRLADRELELVLWNAETANENTAVEFPLYTTEEAVTLPPARTGGVAEASGALAMHLFTSNPPAYSNATVTMISRCFASD